MARSRNIKPNFFTDEDVVELHPLTRLMFIGMWTLADRQGRMDDKPKQIKMRILPVDNHDVDAALNELVLHRFIIRYEVGGNKYIQIRNFSKHQSPHKDEKNSVIPAPNEQAPCKPGASTMQAPCKPGGNRPDSFNLIPDSFNLIPDSTTTQVSPTEVIQAQASESEPSTAVSSSKMSVNEFRYCYEQFMGELMPGGLNNEAGQLCRKYPRDKLLEAFKITAEQGGHTLKYLKKVLAGKPRDGNGRQPKTFDQIRLENIKNAMKGAMYDEAGLAGIQFADG